MAAHQRMIAKIDPTQREEALTETVVYHSRDMDRLPNACLEELEAFLDIVGYKCGDAGDRSRNAQEEARQKRKEALAKWHPDDAQLSARNPPVSSVPTKPETTWTTTVWLDTQSHQLIATRVAEALAACQ
ncbi:hypothetical protein Tco_0769080 [Tanacetum coccineum]|uniref:Uncharacterized protein n=1 Tax=Tanacetum coccineum TaxID=301880 RepID=A0ABQ4Z8F7_9ASTR